MECTCTTSEEGRENYIVLFLFSQERAISGGETSYCTEELAAKQAETLGELPEANLQLALLEDINPVQTENGNLRKKLHALEKL